MTSNKKTKKRKRADNTCRGTFGASSSRAGEPCDHPMKAGGYCGLHNPVTKNHRLLCLSFVTCLLFVFVSLFSASDPEALFSST